MRPIERTISCGTTAAALVATAFGVSASPGVPLPAPGAPEAERGLAVLESECSRCHSAEKRKGGLIIGSREDLLEGGDSGPAVVPGAPGESLLVETLFPDADPHMPPKSQLDPEVIQTIEAWVTAGAPWDDAVWDRLRNARHTEPVELAPLPPGFRPSLAVALSPDGKWLAAGRGSTVEVFDVSADGPGQEAPPRPAHRLGGHSDVIQSLAWSPDGARLASGGFRRVLLWDSEGFARLQERTAGLAGRITALEFTAGSGELAIADSVPAARSPIHWWRPGDDRLSTVESAHDDTIFDLEISPDGTLLASASADRFIHLRDAASGELRGSLEGHSGYVLALAFAPGSDRLATGGDDGTIKVWDVSNRKQISSFGARGKNAGAVAGLAWTENPDALKRRSDEIDPERAAKINTDRIVATYESGQPSVFTNLVEHGGGERSKGADENALTNSGVLLAGIALGRESGALFASSPEGSVHRWSPSGQHQLLAYPTGTGPGTEPDAQSR